MATPPIPRILIKSPAWNEGATTEKATKKPTRIIAAPTKRAKTTPKFGRCLRVVRSIIRLTKMLSR